MFLLKGSVLAMALAAAATAFAQAGPAEGRYELRAYVDWPGGRQIVAGDYAAAIAVASRAPRADETKMLVAATNLCVALTMTGEWAKAGHVCDEAVTVAKRVDAPAARTFARGTLTASALSNRGVLRALRGDSAGAANDFEAASRLRGAAVPSRNLARLGAPSSNRLAAVDTIAD